MRSARAAVLAVAVAACGIDLTGQKPLESGSGDPSRADASADGGPTDPTLPIDAGCTPTVVADPLTTLDTARWLTVTNGANAGFPQVVTLSTGALQGTWLQLVGYAARNAKGGVYWKTALPTRAFDITFAFYAACLSTYDCADGMALAWIDAPGPDALLNGDAASVIGMPKLVRGGAVLVDLYENGSLGDGPAPALRVLGLRAEAYPGTYPWVVASTGKNDALLGAVHTLSLKLRGGVVNVTLDGSAVTSANVASAFTGWIGITAATGGEGGLFFVKDFRAETYDCEPL